MFALISLLVGVALSAIFSRFPLAPLRELMEATDNNFSHEFKTPIASNQGFAEMLELGDLTEEERTEYIHTIIEETSRLTTLATNILAGCGNCSVF